MYVYTTQTRLLFNVALYAQVFRTYHLGLDNHIRGTVLGKSWFLQSPGHWSSVALHLGMELGEISPSTLACWLELLLCRSCLDNVLRFHGCSFPGMSRFYLIVGVLVLWLLRYFCSLLWEFPQVMPCDCLLVNTLRCDPLNSLSLKLDLESQSPESG